MHQRYFDGILEQVKVVEGKRTFTRDVNEFMAMRRGNIGVYPAIALVEYDTALPLENIRDERTSPTNFVDLGIAKASGSLWQSSITHPSRNACASQRILWHCK